MTVVARSLTCWIDFAKHQRQRLTVNGKWHKIADLSETIDPLAWWNKYHTELLNWFDAVRKVILVQPSAAAAERIFSILATSFGSQQDRALQDYIECSIMLQYNRVFNALFF